MILLRGLSVLLRKIRRCLVGKPCVSVSCAWNLYHGAEFWGLVWMTESELTKEYKWNTKQKRWNHKKDSRKYVVAV